MLTSRSLLALGELYLRGGDGIFFPDHELVAVITSANFARRDAHALSDRLLVEEVLGS